MSRTARWLVLCGAAWACCAASAAARPDGVVQSKAELIPAWARDVGAWAAAAWEHHSGRRDEAFAFAEAREPLMLEAVLEDVRALRQQMVERPAHFTYRGLRHDQVAPLLRLTAEEERRADINPLLERAAVLHADVAILGTPALQPAPPRGRAPLFHATDGQHVANDIDSYHWTFGYALLDTLQLDPDARAYARAWYLAAGAHFEYFRHVSADDRHFARARQVFPADAAILFRGACALETLASPETRAAFDSVLVTRDLRYETRSPKTDARHAEDLFRAALESDPGATEARLRLARLLEERGEHQLARDDLIRVIGEVAGGPIGYLAQLFLGRAEEALGRVDSARAAYEAAARLYPEAQSPLLALARLEHRAGNRSGALDAMSRLWRLPASRRDRVDPWFEYYLMQARDADERRADLYRAEPSGRQAVSAGPSR